MTAAGFRLAGVDVHVPAPEQVSALFQRLRAESQMLLITAEAASSLPSESLRLAQAADHPLVLVIPDIRERVRPLDIAARLRRQLGMAE